MQGFQRIKKSTKQDQDFARKQFIAALQELENMRASSHPRPEDAVGFSPDVNRRLMAPVPPGNVIVSQNNSQLAPSRYPILLSSSDYMEQARYTNWLQIFVPLCSS